MPADVKDAAQREIVKLQSLVGTIEISGAEPGAVLTIDRQSRGKFPPLGPVRVVAGHHTLRVYKEGFEPFERGLDVAGALAPALPAGSDARGALAAVAFAALLAARQRRAARRGAM